MAEVIADADDLKQMSKSERPGQAALDEVRVAYRDAMADLSERAASVGDVVNVKLPSERLTNGGTA
ncbi:hypothetical protein ELS19_01350 [Halogeometricum borinquense]|uniref:Uncharacterized protein n=1 Tax=Halogeometricum borinquense TaxID=60847 RepID=A0A482T9C6_9EURY|nr:hypothetical protein [Halogeometricum borinquense]RYJ12746.1 hypothetical protein ELS19_01350 [Halogeometricum borinquense]